MTEREEIDCCLKCTKKYCDNCLAREDPEEPINDGLYYLQDRACTVEELAQMRGISIRQMYYRINRGGLDFAMSEYSTYKTYLKEIEKTKKS